MLSILFLVYYPCCLYYAHRKIIIIRETFLSVLLSAKLVILYLVSAGPGI